jgi:hypothetical protein
VVKTSANGLEGGCFAKRCGDSNINNGCNEDVYYCNFGLNRAAAIISCYLGHHYGRSCCEL